MLFCFILSILPYSLADSGLYRQNRCYSCASPIYEGLYHSGLHNYFTLPKNFSAQCDEPMEPRGIHVVPCRTICLTVTQDLMVMGQPTGHRLTMRGCALSLSKRGINNHTLSMFDRYDICREMSSADLFRHDHADSQRVRVCSCLGDRCNGVGYSNGSRSSLLLVLLLTILLGLR